MNILNTYNEFNINHFELNVDHYGAEICDSLYSFGPAVRDNYVLHFIVHGQGTFTIDGKTIPLKEGDIFLLPKNKVTFYQADRFNPWTYVWVGFRGSKAESIIKDSALSESYYCHSNLESPILNQLMELIKFSDEKPTNVTELLLIGELYKLLAFLCQEFPHQSTSSDQELINDYVKQSLKLIHANYDSKIRISDMADKLNLDRTYLYKIFKEKTGYSLKDYILHIKLDKSAQLLSESDLTITEISYSVGYSDPLQFSKIFKKFYKVSPSQYRKENKVTIKV
ncbi:AraC family transcriptional regulator [Streptococcus bovimastitidis]|uniref:AraC family transcriptional regulator n=1 Tax=Streptococcus bovimastitidis TaxID=1856638 RepID=A0A1L8MKU7_9STRE|nr:AraC family transcriptional regulator [Streptococcus bovimastitidis]OJF71373.1 AraC family transcriptional regulator [Streptococcus bovimastitidis]